MSDGRFDRIEDKIDKLSDKVDEKLTDVNEKLSDYNTQLAIHIKGTEQNRKDIHKIYSEMEIVVKHVNFMENVKSFLLTSLKVGGIAATISGAIIGVLKYFKGM